MPKKAFDFVRIRETRKPKKSGIIEIRGSYYSPVTYTYLRDLFELAGDYIDGFKFAGGSQRLHDSTLLRKIIKLCHDNGVYVSSGGFLERVIVQGSSSVDKYLLDSKRFGFDVIEVSSGLAPIPLESKIKIIRKIKRLGMRAKPEVAFMKGAGAGTQIRGYKSTLRPLPQVMGEAQAYLDAGAYMLMFESEGITEDMPQSKWRTDIIHKVIKKFGIKKWMFEAADPAVFKWYLKNYGSDVNFFIDHSQIIEFEAWRSQLWGDPRIWKGKKLSYM